ncbi:MarR family winged helix-turn-helix transcriptional regulator, partial [Streptococcus ferus]
MERNGWIYRKTDASDKRASVVGLTQSGRDLIEQIMPEHRVNVQAVFSVLTAEEQEQLIHLLKKFKHLKP